MTTDTPRTDASKVDKGGMTFVWLEFAHELERELSVSKAEVVALAQAIHSRTDPYPEWAICDSVTGIISQINNMVGGVLDRAEKAESEVERLRTQLKRAVEIAEGFCGCGCGGDYGLCNFCSCQFSELDQIKSTLYPTDK